LSICNNMRLANGKLWAMPIILDLSEDEVSDINDKSFIIKNSSGSSAFIIKNPEFYEVDKALGAKLLYGTNDINHPGVYNFLNLKKYFVGGEVVRIPNKGYGVFSKYYKTPAQTREIFKKNNWRFVAAFQTRNPPHRSHEFIQKKSLEEVDGLLIHPIMGQKKKGDIKDEFILGAYEILINKYYKPKTVELATFHTFMRYAGPRDAVFHALVRRNFGCTHMIIGRDHAGVGSYYGPYDAHDKFDEFNPEELGIKIIKHSNVSFCKECNCMRAEGECNHSDEYKVYLSGTEFRNRLSRNKHIPETFMRADVVKFLKSKKNIFV